MAKGAVPFDQLIGGDGPTELASQRTSMAFERTARSSDRTLMSVVRTSLSLIAFGFTIFQFFRTLNDKFLDGRLPDIGAQRLGLGMTVLGVILLSLGIYDHGKETLERRRRCQRLFELNLVHQPEAKRLNSSMVIAVLLWLLGFWATLRLMSVVGIL